MSHIVTAGITAGGFQPRLEINNFVRNDRHFSLYVQALQRMYNDPQTNFTSFFQVGGIHGLPFTTYDGSTVNPPVDPNNQWAGYCTHGSVLFPTWHRPYVMLIEQILNGYAQQIAATYTNDTAGWQQAATTLRQPYWDWAANSVPPAEVISSQTVTITAPNGARTAVPNPLLRYRFHPIDPSFPAPYSRWQTTLRQPTSARADATDNVTRLRSVLQNAQRSIRSATFNMLTRVRTWPAFASHTVGDGGSASNSVEAIHDNIHVLVGGNGQMSDPAVAAFDPIFFMHHANVDRLLSLWAAINPTVWVSNGDAEGGTFTLQAEAPVGVNTDLTPFWDTQTSFWKSTQVRDTRTLGYTYPEFVGVNVDNPTTLRTTILNTVNRLYGGSARALAARDTDEVVNGTVATEPSNPQGEVLAAAVQAGGGASEASVPHTHAHRHARNARAHHGSSSSNSQLHSRAEKRPNKNYHDWAVQVQFKKYELGGSFSVLFFLGDVPNDPNEWLVSPKMIGAHNAFVNSIACPNCHRQQEMVEQGFVPLNDGLGEHSGLPSYDPTNVGPYLKQHLNWRVQKTDGTPMDLDSLEITVVDVPMSVPPGAVVPVQDKPAQPHDDITRGRYGGKGRA